nr:MAG TPA: hypothetical protein [Caudoviricetes sp.]
MIQPHPRPLSEPTGSKGRGGEPWWLFKKEKCNKESRKLCVGGYKI